MFGPYILCTLLHGFNRKTKNVHVFAVWFSILFYVQFYLPILFLFKISMTSDIVILIDYLRGIYMTIPFQIIQRWIGKYKFYDHCIPVWYVHDVFHAAEGVSPSRTPLFTCCYFSSLCLWRSPFLVHGCHCHTAPSLSMWCGGRANCTLRLPHLAPIGLSLSRAWAGAGGLFVHTSRLHSLSVVYTASTWLVSGVG